ncbi:hypothetical protein [Marinifilum sp. D714]|uniref:hypothetical protein n=1 Tax=Marinifilum sp. D714 TaxID=2937523 RepID=UPI0027CFD673|nr:hypothetical protein [Marinifilum sp. D714]MDQ2179751.1 hypothetical protein [Marinifilum sp. D714]
MKDLNEFGVSEMETSEIKNLNGGGSFWGPVGAGLIIATFVAVISDWDNFKKGLAGEPEIKN